MIYAVLFVIAFFIGLVAYLITGKWLSAALISMGLFVLNTLSDFEHSDKAIYTILLGLPVVFCASLFGAYVVELRRGTDADQLAETNDEETNNGGEKEHES